MPSYFHKVSSSFWRLAIHRVGLPAQITTIAVTVELPLGPPLRMFSSPSISPHRGTLPSPPQGSAIGHGRSSERSRRTSKGEVGHGGGTHLGHPLVGSMQHRDVWDLAIEGYRQKLHDPHQPPKPVMISL